MKRFFGTLKITYQFWGLKNPTFVRFTTCIIHAQIYSLVLYKMLRTLTIISLLFLIPQRLLSQILPKEGNILNYRLIGFSFPAAKPTVNYTIEIASGHLIDESSFRKNIIKSFSCKTNKVILEVPYFGAQYTWRTIYTSGNSTTKNALHHFSTGTIPEVDTSNIRLRITDTALNYKDAYVLLDGSKVMYDMKGNPVWYLPAIDNKTVMPRDLKVTVAGTITFVEADAYEINYDGTVLWKAPDFNHISGQPKESWHHEFTRLTNGNYMIYANEFLFCNMQPDSTMQIDYTNKAAEPKSVFGVLAEFDASGKILWQWKSSEYFDKSDLKYYKSPDNKQVVDILHENSFIFDEQNKLIYISAKNLNRIIKIKYPEGTILNSYGENFYGGNTSIDNHLFCGQHSIRRSQDGNLYLFNNNGCHFDNNPTVIEFQEPNEPGGTLKKIWEYECKSEGPAHKGLPSGGNVIELPDKSIFVYSPGAESTLFIVNKKKEILWRAVSEKYNEDDKKWYPLPNYRASIIFNRKDLEKLVWNSSKKR